jgi:hypothetical protein
MILLAVAVTPTDAIEWWYPVAVWSLVLAAVARAVQNAITLVAPRAAAPHWLPLAFGALSFLPVAGLPLGRWLHGLNGGFSIPFAALLLDFTITPLIRRPLLPPAANRAAVWFGFVAGWLLYPAALGLGPYDPYALGWRSPGVATAAAILGAGLTLRHSAFGVVLLSAGLLWQLGCLESDNAWDYLVDPIYWVVANGNLIAGWVAQPLRRLRGSRARRAVVAACVACLGCGGARASTASADEPRSLMQLDDAWATSSAVLERRAKNQGQDRLAEYIRTWPLPSLADRQLVLLIPPTSAPPEWIDTAEEETIWRDFCTARKERAQSLFLLAVAAAQAHGKPPTRAERGAATTRRPLDQQSCAAVRLLALVLREDPDHERARQAGGWVRRDGRWLPPEAARRLDKGEEYSERFGWLPKGRRARYEAGERYEHGRWVKGDADGDKPQKPPSVEEGRKFFSDHWQITSTARRDEAAGLARKLEETHAAWWQVFGAFAVEPADQEKLFEGRGRIALHDPFNAILLADRRQYVAELEKLEPTIARTLGIYWTPTRTAWFFDPQDADGGELSTVHHEATHPLFAETRKTSPLAGERCGFWAIEAAACYMESLEPTAFGWTLGGRDAGRVPAARERLVDDGFFVPLEELSRLGRTDFQADDRLPGIYSQIAGLADFFMNGEQGRHREAFVEYLSRIYTGTVDPDTLARLCGTTCADLDDAYRRHMTR